MRTTELNDYDLYLFHQGTNFHTYEMLGAHFTEQDGQKGVRFAVWAPNAKSISVVGDFNDWNANIAPMTRLKDGEVWSTFIPGVEAGAVYKYAIEPQWGGPRIMKADPYGFFSEKNPKTASRTYNLEGYEWQDGAWADEKAKKSSYEKPMLIYEAHLGSWRRTMEGQYLSYRDMADQLIGYVKKMNYTHLEVMPLCEHPFDGSWGYQITGYYAVTSRFGEPNDFRYLVETAHKNGIGIIMDWVPGHFCKDEQGLRHFDGKTLYESDNEQRAENWEWGTTNFDYGRTEVQSFLISNAMFWFEEYHIDGLRIDAVANMLYLNYGRKDGQWQPNKYGDTGNLEAMDFLKKLNEAIFKYHPNALMIAEESTSWPLISKPVYMGGMGFNYKWNMGWMNDMLKYMSLDPIYRKWNHDKVTFSFMYAFSENFVLPLSHDEVVHGKCSLISKMPGDYWQQFAGLRAFFGYWMAHPGKKLLFMGGEFGQFIEWNENDSLDWHLTEQYPKHKEMLHYSQTLNKFYLDNKALWEVDFDWNGFQWIDCDDSNNSVISFVRKAKDGKDFLIAICNFTPEVRHDYRIGVPEKGGYVEVFNSDAYEFGGSNVLNEGVLWTEDVGAHNRPQSLRLTIPPLAVTYLRLKEVPQVEKAPEAKKNVAADAAPAARRPRKTAEEVAAKDAVAVAEKAVKAAEKKAAKADKAVAELEDAPKREKAPGAVRYRRTKAELAADKAREARLKDAKDAAKEAHEALKAAEKELAKQVKAAEKVAAKAAKAKEAAKEKAAAKAAKEKAAAKAAKAAAKAKEAEKAAKAKVKAKAKAKKDAK